MFSKIWLKLTTFQINTTKLAFCIFLLVFSVHLLFYFQLKFKKYVFDTISIPDELVKSGITEEYVAHYTNVIVNRIINYEKPIRNAQVESQATEDLDLSNTQSEHGEMENIPITSDALGLAITFKQLAYFTDKLFSIFGFDGSKQYVSIHIVLKDQKLEMSSFFKNKIRNAGVRFEKDDMNRNDSVHYLCYQTALLIAEESYPDKLAEYLYNRGDLYACMNVCVKALSQINFKNNTEVVASLYNFWALSLTYNYDYIHKPIENVGTNVNHSLKPTLEQSIEIISKIDNAIELSRYNKTLYKINKAYILCYLEYNELELKKYHSELITKGFQLLPRKEKLALSVAYYDIKLSLFASKYNKLLDDPQKSTKKQSDITDNYRKLYIDSIYSPLLQVQKDYEDVMAPENYFLIAQILSSKSHLYPNVLNFTIQNYKTAIDKEIQKKSGSYYKLSEYYNSLAFAYERVAMGEKDILEADSTHYCNINDSLLQKIKFSVTQAMNYYSSNPWPYTTYAEYCIIQALKAEGVNADEVQTYLNKAELACKKAQKYGVYVSEYQKYYPYRSLFRHKVNLLPELKQINVLDFKATLDKLNVRQ